MSGCLTIPKESFNRHECRRPAAEHTCNCPPVFRSHSAIAESRRATALLLSAMPAAAQDRPDEYKFRVDGAWWYVNPPGPSTLTAEALMSREISDSTATRLSPALSIGSLLGASICWCPLPLRPIQEAAQPRAKSSTRARR